MRFLTATPETLAEQVQAAILAGHQIIAVSDPKPPRGSILITTIPPGPLEELEIDYE